MPDEPLRFPLTIEWTEDSARARLLDHILVAVGPLVFDEWCPVEISVPSRDVGAELVTHFARWLGRSEGKPSHGAPPLRLTGTMLIQSLSREQSVLGGKLSFDEPHAEVYFDITHDRCRFAAKDEGYAAPLLRHLTRAFRDGADGPTRFPRKSWEPVAPLVDVGPADDLDPLYAVDAALRSAGIREDFAVGSTETLRVLLIDPRTCKDALLVIHARFMAGDLGDELRARGRGRIDTAMLLQALVESERLIDPYFDEEPHACLEDLRLLWSQ